jgi:hypothetical protein
MSFFKDSKYESLDWISQAVEPMESSLNTVLSKMPDIIELDCFALQYLLPSDISSHYGQDYSIDLDDLFSKLNNVVRYEDFDSLSYESKRLFHNCYELRVISPDSEQRPNHCFSVNFNAEKVSCPIFLVKIVKSFDDKQLLKILGKTGIKNHISWSGTLQTRIEENPSRYADVMDILGNGTYPSVKSQYKRRNLLENTLLTIMSKNEWNLKDTDLADKVSQWIAEYINDGNLSSWATLCKLKVMTHSKAPIYSVEEVK